MAMRLRLVRTEEVPDRMLDFARGHYERRFLGYLGVEVAGDRIGLDSKPFRDGIKGRQYLADEILQEGIRLEGKGLVIIVTSADIYTYGTNYIFGLATIGAGLVSWARMDPRFWEGVPEIFNYYREGEGFLLKQFAKVLLHEVGHALSLSHCHDLGCVMRYSNSPIELYSKGEDYCRRCWTQLVANMKALV